LGRSYLLFSDVNANVGIEEKTTSAVIKRSTLFHNTKLRQMKHFKILLIVLKVNLNILPDDGHEEPKHVVKLYIKFIKELWRRNQ
jgi:hypothetical protein